jgi:hypothetical protein
LLRVAVPSLQPAHPLSDLEGMSVWYEARLLEGGIEDMQGLATANLADLLLQVQVPTGRLIDWIDQALLLVHVGGVERRLAPKLRQLGIRTATDLLALFPAEGMDDSGSKETATKQLLESLGELGVDAATVHNLARILAREPQLQVVRNWKDGNPAHSAGRSAKHT